MNIELIKVAEWFNANKLSLNLEKTNFILFSSARKTASRKALFLNGISLNQTQSTKFLGVIIDQHLTWHEHITLITKKISKNLGVLARIRHNIPFQSLISLYYTLIYPYLSYCNIVWGHNFKSYLHNLITLQKRAVRIICHLPYYAGTQPSFRHHKILSLENINKYQILLYMFRLHNKLLPKAISIDLQTGTEIHSHYTRSAHHYRSHHARLRVKQFSLPCTGPHLWNSLPESLKNLKSVNSFKRSIKSLLVDSCCI